MVKEIKSDLNLEWLDNSTIAYLNVSADALLIKTILVDTDFSYVNVSLLGDNRVLISFASKGDRDSFMSQKMALKDYFMDICI